MTPNEFIELAGTQGIFAALFISLLCFQIKANADTVKRFEVREKNIFERAEKRESQLLEMIDSYKTALAEYKVELTKLTDAVNRLCEKIDKIDRKA